jgi:hypothetical protein
MTKFVTLSADGTVDVVYLYDPRSEVNAVEVPDGVFEGWREIGTSWEAPANPTLTVADLRAYANAKQWALATGGYTVTIDGIPRTFPTDSDGRGLINGKVARLALPNPPASFRWQFGTEFVTISANDIKAVGAAIADFVQATFDALDRIFPAIDAGTITTTAEIDAWTWPEVLPL